MHRSCCLAAASTERRSTSGLWGASRRSWNSPRHCCPAKGTWTSSAKSSSSWARTRTKSGRSVHPCHVLAGWLASAAPPQPLLDPQLTADSPCVSESSAGNEQPPFGQGPDVSRSAGYPSPGTSPVLHPHLHPAVTLPRCLSARLVAERRSPPFASSPARDTCCRRVVVVVFAQDVLIAAPDDAIGLLENLLVCDPRKRFTCAKVRRPARHQCLGRACHPARHQRAGCACRPLAVYDDFPSKGNNGWCRWACRDGRWLLLCF